MRLSREERGEADGNAEESAPHLTAASASRPDPFMGEVNRWLENRGRGTEPRAEEVVVEEGSKSVWLGVDTSSASNTSSAVYREKDRGATTDAEALRRGSLIAWDGREDLARALAERLGIDFERQSTWTVAGAELTVNFWLDRRGLYVLRVFEGWPKRQSLALAQAFAIATMGALRIAGTTELARWKLRMLVELGFVAPVKVELAPLPLDATPNEIATWRIIGELLSVRRLTEPVGEPFTFSAPWVAVAYAVGEKVIRSGKLSLSKRGYIRKVGAVKCGRGRPADIWQAKERDQ